jgi:hypothetical protein
VVVIFQKRYDKCLLVQIKRVELWKASTKNRNFKLINPTLNNKLFSVATKFDETNFGSFGVFSEIHLKIARRKGGKKVEENSFRNQEIKFS